MEDEEEDSVNPEKLEKDQNLLKMETKEEKMGKIIKNSHLDYSTSISPYLEKANKSEAG